MTTSQPQQTALKIFATDTSNANEIPLLLTGIAAGFPSPADDYIEAKLDLNKLLIKNKSATFFGRASGNSMINAGIYDGDLLVIDKSQAVRENSILVCCLDGEFTVKRVKKISETSIFLMPDNDDFEPIEVEAHNNLTIWGVVTYSIHKQ